MSDPFGPAMATLPLSALVDSEVPESVPRDRWKRPLILQPDGTLEPYSRISTVAGALDSGHGLGIWKLRHAALSIARNEDLAAMVAALEYGDPELDDIIEVACERSKDMVEARHWGTAVHSFTDHHPECRARTFVPERIRPDVQSYDDALKAAGLECVETNVLVVDDRRKVAGTLDGLYASADGEVYCADKKTGKLKPLYLNVQLGLYCGARRYDPSTGERSDIHPALNRETALAVHIPLGASRTDIYRVDLERAGRLAGLACRVHGARAGEKSLLSPW